MSEKPTYTASKETLRRVAAEMAGIQFTDEELEQLAPQVAALLADLSTLEELDLSQVEPALLFISPEEFSHGR
jgi:Asp-tRNA(Asn)/Glu-tRNA(Gln) amidotransferase C subunit